MSHAVPNTRPKRTIDVFTHVQNPFLAIPCFHVDLKSAWGVESKNPVREKAKELARLESALAQIRP